MDHAHLQTRQRSIMPSALPTGPARKPAHVLLGLTRGANFLCPKAMPPSMEKLSPMKATTNGISTERRADVPKQRDEAVHGRKKKRCDDADGHGRERHGLFRPVRMDGGEKERHHIQKRECGVEVRPVVRRGVCRKPRLPRAEQHGQHCREDGQNVDCGGDVFSGGVQQLIGGCARDGRDEDRRRDGRQEHQHHDQQRNADRRH